MKKYSSCKNSEVSWFGLIPKTWKLSRIKELSINVKTGATPTSSNGDFFSDGTEIWYTPSDLNNNVIFDSTRKVTKEALLRGEIAKFPPDSIYLVGIGGTLGKVGISSVKAGCNQQINVIVFDRRQLFPKYGFYLMLVVGDTLIKWANYTTMPIFTQTNTKQLAFLVPTLEEQTTIASYLDTKTQAIDKKVSLLEKKIGYYQELRKSLINETVTKGLDKNVKLKDSGIDWIGQIPEHWEVVRIKDYTYVKARIGWQGLRSDEFELSGDYYCVTGTDFQNGQIDWSNCYHVEKVRFEQDKKIILREGDLLITKDGSIGKIAIVQSLPKPATLNSGVFVTRPRLGKYLNEHMYWILSSRIFLDFIDLNKNGTTILHLYQNVFENFFYCLPPISEQKEISDYLLLKTSKIAKIITNIQTQITTLKELRKTLINDVVTGKIKVSHE